MTAAREVEVAVRARRPALPSSMKAPPVALPALELQRLAGNRAVARLQSKLTINEPGDAYEQEADRVADQVMRMAEPAVQRSCGCGGTCGSCGDEDELQRATSHGASSGVDASAAVHDVLRSPGEPLDPGTRTFMEARFDRDFSAVRVHPDAAAAHSAHTVDALAYTVGEHVVFGAGQYRPATADGRRLLAHELTHVIQQGSARAPPTIQRRAAPYIKKVTVHLTPPQSADLEWQGTPPSAASGSDHFTVSTGKGYDNPGDPPGTCTRHCCTDPDTQCAPPWNRPDRVGACCTYYGNNFWTGTPQDEHNGWLWWTPIQPFYSQRGIALHQHTEVTGQPIGHGCVRMDEPNAKRIYDYSNGRGTNVTIDGRAAPVACETDRHCDSSASVAPGGEQSGRFAGVEPVPGREGEMT